MARISDSPVGLKVVVRYWERGLVGLCGSAIKVVMYCWIAGFMVNDKG